MDKAWSALVRYKMLEDRVKELKRKAWSDLPPNEDIEESIRVAEAELNELKSWIQIKNDDVRAWD